MKHLKSYNEGVFKKNPYNHIVNKIMERVKETFDISNLTYEETKLHGIVIKKEYTYTLEETSTDSGYIHIYSCFDNLDKDYILEIDGERMKCSSLTRIGVFLELEELKKKGEIDKIKNKYKAIL